MSFFFINILLSFCSLLVVFGLDGAKKKSMIRALLMAFVIYVTFILLIGIGLGVFGVLNFQNVSLVVGVLFVGLLIVFWRRAFRNFKKIGNINWPSLKQWPVGGAIFGPVGGLLLMRFFSALFHIPLEYDNNAYHMPFVLEWFQTGDLTGLYYSAFAGPLAYYPSNFELLDLWTFLPSGSDFLVNVLNFPVFVLIGLVMYFLIRKLGVSKMIALVASGFMFYMPVVLRHAGVPLVDLFFILFFLLAVYFMLTIENWFDVLIFGLSFGVFIGTKYLGVPYGAILLLIFIGIVLYQKRQYLSRISLAFGGTLLTGGFFYIRNWIEAGNPIFPLGVEVFGVEIFQGYPGVNAQVASTSLLTNLLGDDKVAVFREVLGDYYNVVGLLMLAIALAFVLLAFKVLHGAIKKKFDANWWRYLLLVGAGFVFLVLYLKAPYTYRDLVPNVRYALPFLVMGILAIASVANWNKWSRNLFFLGAAVVFVHSFFFLILNPSVGLAHNDVMTVYYDLVLGNMKYFVLYVVSILLVTSSFVFILKFTKLRISAALITFFFGIGLFVPVGTFALLEREEIAYEQLMLWYETDEVLKSIIDAEKWLSDNDPEARNIAYTGFNFHYLLYGRDFSRDVDYVNINECLECRYVDYKNNSLSIRRDPFFSDWWENLVSLEKDYLLIELKSMAIVKNHEYDWAVNHPSKFKLVFSQNGAYLYKINR